MTSFTPISHSETPCISLDPLNTISNINPNIYGGFTEHMGRCIYGGLYDPESPLADENGFRKDVIEVMKELQVPVVRYPGGNFVATYHWLDGVGPRKSRPKRPELAWLGIEPNQFGTDEFMKWCNLVGTEPYLCFNMGTGTLDEALGWLEYCNSAKDTYYANLRRKNGHPEPYNVRYWALGNEVWGPWQVLQTDAKTYARVAYQWAKALKLLDPSITLVLCGETGFSNWDHTILKETLHWHPNLLGGSVTSQLIDMVSIHIYTASDQHVPNVLAPRAAERAILNVSSLINLSRVQNKIPATMPSQTICFDEWNVWDSKRAPGNKGGEERYSLSDALAVAVYLNVFIRQAQHLGMANIAQSVNVLSPILTTPSSLTKQTTFYPLLLFTRYMRGQSLAVHLRCAEYEGEMTAAKSPDGSNFGWLKGSVGLGLLDVSATVSYVDGSKWISIAVVNADADNDTETLLNIADWELEGKDVDVYTVAGSSPDATNCDGQEEVGIEESTWNGIGLYTFPRASLTLLRWKQLQHDKKANGWI